MKTPHSCQRTTATTAKMSKVCPKCHLIGLVMMYDFGQRMAVWYCGSRDLPSGEFILGCQAITQTLPMTKAQFDENIERPEVRASYFILKTL